MKTKNTTSTLSAEQASPLTNNTNPKDDRNFRDVAPDGFRRYPEGARRRFRGPVRHRDCPQPGTIADEVFVAKQRLCGNETTRPLLEKVFAPTQHDSVAIAKLAAKLSGEKGGCDEYQAVMRATQLWRLASSTATAEEQERSLLAGLLELDQDEWEHQIEAYEGGLLALAGRFERTFIRADTVLRILFRNKTETEDSRREKLIALADFANTTGHRRYSRTGESLEISPRLANEWLDDGEIDLLTCRWLVVARQKQIAAIRKEASSKY